MALITQVYTNTLSNQSLATALLVGTFTNTTRIRKLYVSIFIDQVAGAGDYIANITVQRAGAGSAYTSVKTTLTLASGVTSGYFGSIAIVLNATDVMKVYVIGLAGDTTTPDVIVDVNEEWQNIDASGRVDVGAWLGSAPNTLATGRVDASVGAYPGNTPQTGDNFARIGAAGAGLSALGDTRIANLDATVSSRSTYAGTDTAGTTTLLTRLTAARASYLDLLNTFLDSAVSAVKTVVDAILARTDVATSTRLAASAYTSPPSAAVVSAQVWGEPLPGAYAAGSAGAKLTAAGGAADPLTNAVPGAYAAGTAGAALGNIPAIKAKTDLITSGTPITVVSTSVVAGNAITVYQGTHWRIQLLGLGDLSLRTKLYFTVKQKTADPDSAAIAQLAVSKPGAGSDGLLVMNGATATLSDGSIVVDNEVLGNITINVKASATTDVGPTTWLQWDVKAEGADADNLPREVARGAFIISQGETRSIA